jgi:TatD DNase family protein
MKKSPLYFDVHSHLNFKDFDTDRNEQIEMLKQERIWTTTVGTDLKTSEEAVELAKEHQNLFATIGLHPIDNKAEVFDETAFDALVTNPKVLAIGECGLDYARSADNSQAEKARQKEEFEKQIEFAVKHTKPLMIHCRDAFPDALEILRSKKKEHGDKLKGNFHFFTSPIDIAKQCLEIDFMISFTGPITFVPQYAAVVSYVPLECMMAETDAPFAAPIPYRGKRNSPLYIKDIVKKIADVKLIELEEARSQLLKNTIEFFGLHV